MKLMSKGIMLSVIFVIAAGFLLLRGYFPPVVDDTPTILILDETGPGVAHWPGRLWSEMQEVFSVLNPSGYRPLSNTIGSYIGGSIGIGALSFSLWTAVVGVFIGLTAVVTFALGRRVTGSPWGGAIAAVLLLGCPPFVAAAWVVYGGIQTLVPLLLGTGILLYLDVADGRAGRFGWRWWALAAILLFGVWVREFVAMLGGIMIAAELWRVRRPTPAMALGLAGLLHGLFPTALIHFLFVPDLPVAPVFKLGWLASQVAGKDPRLLKPEVAIYALQLIPPSFLLLIGIALLTGRAEGPLRRLHRILCAAIAGGAALAALAGWLSGEEGFLALAALFVTAAPAALALRSQPVIAIWYTAAYLPFFKLFAQETHLAYMAQPLALIAALAAVQLWRRCAALPRPAASGLRTALAAVVAVLLVDQALIVSASRRVTKAMAEANVRIDRFLSVTVPARSELGTNLLSGYDIQLFSRGHVRSRFTFPGSDFEPAAARAAAEGRKVYLLAGEYPYLPGKAPYHRNVYADAGPPGVVPLGRLLSVRVVYPFLDPLRLWTERPYVSYLGPPDQVNDVYAGPHRGGRPFLREHYLAYDLYRLDDPTPRRPAADSVAGDGTLRLVEEGRGGYNILAYQGRFYAVPQATGAVDGPGLAERRYGDAVIDRRRLAWLYAALDTPEQDRDVAALPDWLSELGVVSPQPLPATGLDGFTVYRTAAGVVGVAADSGPRMADGVPSQWFAAADMADLARRVRAVRAPVDLSVLPWLVTWNPADMTMRPAPIIGNRDTPTDPAALLGVWRFRGRETRILAGPDGSLRLINEFGQEARGVLRDGQVVVPGWSLVGRVSADGHIIDWGNFSRWYR